LAGIREDFRGISEPIIEGGDQTRESRLASAEVNTDENFCKFIELPI